MNSVEFQIVDSKYVVDYTWTAAEDQSLVIDENQTRFGFKYENNQLSHSVMPKGYGEALMNDIMQRLFEIEAAKSQYVNGLWFYCSISREECKNSV